MYELPKSDGRNKVLLWSERHFSGKIGLVKRYDQFFYLNSMHSIWKFTAHAFICHNLSQHCTALSPCPAFSPDRVRRALMLGWGQTRLFSGCLLDMPTSEHETRQRTFFNCKCAIWTSHIGTMGNHKKYVFLQRMFYVSYTKHLLEAGNTCILEVLTSALTIQGA